MPNKTYNSYNAENFLDDADFLRYVKYNNPSDVSFWNNWQAVKPENLKSFKEAKLQLQLILSDQPKAETINFRELLLQDINLSVDAIQKSKKRKLIRLVWTSGIAASFLMVTLISWFFLSEITIKSDFAENRLVHLPDGSEVKLNANSSLTYARAFNWKVRREVHLAGEAYFKVKHININSDQVKKGELFIAITDGASVQVLGTEFNLKDRHRKTSVALIKGKIQVSSNSTGKSYVMHPGDFIDLDGNGNSVENVNDFANQTAWLSGKIVVNQTTVNEILREFEDLYGYKVMLDSPALGNKKIDGAISIKSEESLLFTLKNILNVDIQKEGKTIYLKNRR
ncbi:FecR family protein [Pedobacter jeongneungensis]|uniref:FecR family protein n=1 Tax=Pedobacter jeongneungensis TaxID=947309 RepID=UPI000468B17E|nr:FecR domain-containing protein [Pedobacter jeongneungensis]